MGENERDSLTAQVFWAITLFFWVLLISREALEAKHRLLLPFHLHIPVKSSKAGKGELFFWCDEAELWRCWRARQSLKMSDSSIVGT